MKFGFMRGMDRYAGSTVVALLLPLVVLRDFVLKPSGIAPGDVRTVLVEKFFGIGSIMNMTQMIEALRHHYPNAQVIFLAFCEQRAYLDIADIADKVILIDSRNFLRFAISTISALVQLRRIRIDVCVDAEFFSKFSGIMSILSGARVRAGFGAYHNIRTQLLTHPVSFNHYVHVSRSFLAIAEALGAPVTEQIATNKLPLLPDSYDDELRQAWSGIDTVRYVVINCNTSQLSTRRSWPLERFASLIRRMADRYPDHHFVLIGSPSEKCRVSELAGMVGDTQGRVVDLGGRTSFGGLMKLIEHAALLISNDSGPAHIAAGYGIPEVVLFGPETPVLYGPRNPNAQCIYVPPYCSPCLSVIDNKRGETCEQVLCMGNIRTDTVFAAVERVLQPAAAAAMQ